MSCKIWKGQEAEGDQNCGQPLCLGLGSERGQKEEKDETYTRKEFNYNAFKRSLKLPASVNPDQKVKASYKNGILNLHLQKKDEAKAATKKIIEIN